MKKTLAMLLVMVLIIVNCGVVSAATIKDTYNGNNSWTTGDSNATKDNNSITRKVTVNRIADTAVYSVDVEWGSMEFNYKAGTWNPDTKSYSDNGTWSIAADDVNDIIVTNNSNVKINAALSAKVSNPDNTTGYTISYGFQTRNASDKSNITVAGSTTANSDIALCPINGPANTYAQELVVGGVLGNEVTNAQIGSVTVTITDAP